MRISLSILLLSFALSFNAYGDQNILSPDGYGKIQFGSKISKVEVTLKERAIPEKREPCDQVRFKKYPGILFMVENEIITRADVVSSKIINSANVKIGMSFKQVMANHPNMLVEIRDHYPTGHYLTLHTSDGRASFKFVEDNGKIIKIYAGIQPYVENLKGCSSK